MTTSEAFLRTLSDDDRAALEERWTVRGYRRKEMVISHGEEGRDVFFLLEGRARATVYSEGGRAVAYRDMEPGDIFGELAAIDGRSRSASIMALDPIRVARLSEAALRDIVNMRPSFTWALLRHLSAQVRRMTERVYEFSTLVVISPAPTHFDLAAKISTHREAVSREMSALAKRHLIERRGDGLVLRDIATLEMLCGEEE
jgi:CRP-like cAMP-binding protein